MLLTHALIGEHGVLNALLDHVGRSLARGPSPEAFAALQAPLASHSRMEEALLFPALEEQIGPEGLLSTMRSEHEEIETALRELSSGEATDAVRRGRDLVLLTREHFANEENVLFPLAERVLGDAILGALALRWAEARGVEIGR